MKKQPKPKNRPNKMPKGLIVFGKRLVELGFMPQAAIIPPLWDNRFIHIVVRRKNGPMLDGYFHKDTKFKDVWRSYQSRKKKNHK